MRNSPAFVSYSRANSEFVLRLVRDLRSAGSAVWLDQMDIQPGELWDHAIEAALKSCPKQLVVLSPEAVQSENVMDEVSFALEQRKKVIPVLCKDCEIPFRLRRVQYIDFRTNYKRGLEELLRVLETTHQPETLQQGVAAGQQTAHSDVATGPAPNTKPRTTSANDLGRPELSPVEPRPEDAAWGRRETGKSKIKLWMIAAGVIVLVLAVVLWQLELHSRTDAQVVSDVLSKISLDSRIPDNQQITDSVNKGIVTLSGTVNSESEKTAAGEDALAIDGVKSVINNLQVVSSSSDAGRGKHKDPSSGEKQKNGPGSQQDAKPDPEKKPDYLARGPDVMKYAMQVGLYGQPGNPYWISSENSRIIYQFVPDDKTHGLNFVEVQPPQPNPRIEQLEAIERYGPASDAFSRIVVQITWDNGMGQTYRKFDLSPAGKLFNCSETTLYSTRSETQKCTDTFVSNLAGK